MYCVIQEVKLKKPDIEGASKYIEPYTWSCGNDVHHSYRMSNEQFKRNIKKAYKISIHHSYRENGKVKKKQWVICTIGHYYIIDYGNWIGDCCRLEDKLEAIGISEEKLCDLVYAKLDPLTEKIENEYKEELETILQKDPHAIALNGYIHGMFFEDATINHMVDAVKHYYEEQVISLENFIECYSEWSMELKEEKTQNIASNGIITQNIDKKTETEQKRGRVTCRPGAPSQVCSTRRILFLSVLGQDVKG